MSSADGWMKVTVPTQGGNGYPVASFRYTNSGTAHYGITLNIIAGELGWERYTSATGAGTLIQAITTTVTATDTWAFAWQGSGASTVIRCWRNPTGSTPDSGMTTWGSAAPTQTFTTDPGTPVDSGTYCGLGGAQSNAGEFTFDDFTFGDPP
jgi:hypothetical protein